MNYYHTPSGERISKSEINKRISETKRLKLEQQKNENGFNFCEECSKNNFEFNEWDDLEYGILDCSHKISVDECQKNGLSELAWNLNNIRILCRYHHRIHDKINLKFKANEK